MKMSQLEACRLWVRRDMNSIPQALIVKAYYENGDIDAVRHLTYDEKDGNLVYGQLPMWGTMWTFADSLDEEWARNNLDIMKKCGFEVYETDEIGLFFGIDGAGYDFYEHHWIPLYLARGLRWHAKEGE